MAKAIGDPFCDSSDEGSGSEYVPIHEVTSTHRDSNDEDAQTAGITGCKHDVVFCGLCASCGADVSCASINADDQAGASTAPNAMNQAQFQLQRPGFITPSLDLQVSSALLGGIEEAEQQRRLEVKQFVLILDIDHTLLVTGSAKQLAQVRSYRLKNNISKIIGGHHVKLRPHLHEFLQEAQSMCELYLYTHGTGDYAQAIVRLVDPQGIFFGSPPRLFHRNNTPLGLKNVHEIFPAETSLVIVVDDRDEVWGQSVRASHLIKVSPYLFYGGDGRAGISLEGFVASCQPSPDPLHAEAAKWVDGEDRDGKRLKKRKLDKISHSEDSMCDKTRSESESNNSQQTLHKVHQACLGDAAVDDDDPDQQLICLASLLRRIHSMAFQPKAQGTGNNSILETCENNPVLENNTGMPDAGRVISLLRQRALQGCNVCLTGIPHMNLPASRHPISYWCIQLGANIHERLTQQTTHLVAARRDTEKYHEALRRKAAGKRIYIVHPGWVLHAISTWERPAECLFAIPRAGTWPCFTDIWRAVAGAGPGAFTCTPAGDCLQDSSDNSEREEQGSGPPCVALEEQLFSDLVDE